MKRPLLLIDVDGVISLFGFDPARPPDGTFRFVDGIAHFLSADAARHLAELCRWFEPAWCTGWEEKANEYLPEALGLPGPWPYLELGSVDGDGSRHWKLDAIERYAGERRAVAWIDDAHDEQCRTWAATRPGPTLLMGTDPAVGLTAEQASQLVGWAQALAASENTGGSREATLDQVAPASGDPNTSPDVAPK
jgi:hypothetical protein